LHFSQFNQSLITKSK